MDKPFLRRQTCLQSSLKESEEVEEAEYADDESELDLMEVSAEHLLELRSGSPDTVEVTEGERLILEQVESLKDLLSELLAIKLRHPGASISTTTMTGTVVEDGEKSPQESEVTQLHSY